MAGGSTVWIGDGNDRSERARVIAGRLLVDVVGAGAVGDVNIAEYGGAAVGPANPLDVQPGTGACFPVDNCPGTTLSVDDGGVPLSVNGIVAVSDVIPGILAANLGKAEDAPHVTGDTGVMALAVRNDAGGTTAADGDYHTIQIGAKGGVHVEILGSIALSIDSLEPGVGVTNLGKAEDAVHGSGDVGVMALGVRKDTPTALAGTDGDYIPPIFGSDGSQWVRLAGVETIETLPLSESTRGRPIQITGTTTGTANDLHIATTTAGEIDKIFIDLTNTSSAEHLVTIEFGTTGVGNEIDILIPANETVHAVIGVVLGGAATDTIAAYADTGSVINAVGRVERITQP